MVDYATDFRKCLVDLELDQSAAATSYEEGEKWVRLAEHPRYRIYNECKSALTALLTSAPWQALLQGTGRPLCILDLGAGSGVKLAMVSAQLREATLLPIDISGSMLLYAYRTLREQCRHQSPTSRIIPIRVDFERHLASIGDDPRLGPHLAVQKIVMILGNTFGNFRERALLAQIRAFMSSGDVLVIGQSMHTLTRGCLSDVTAELAWYDRDPYLAFWRDPAVNPYYAATIFSRINPDGGQSEVTGSIAIETVAEGLQTPMLTSTRYDAAALTRFVAACGFLHQFSISSPLNVFYQHMVFQKA